MSRERELARQGWKRQTTYDEPRLGEVVQMYAELGFEVRLEPFEPEDETECSVCMQQMPERFKTIYTREKRDE